MTRLAGSVITISTPITANFENTGGGEVATNLRDDNTATKWLAMSSVAQLTYDLTTAQSIGTYSMTSANDADGRDPSAWTLEGSNNGTTFTVIDTKTGIGKISGRGVRVTYFVPSANIAAYRYYKLNITANNGDTMLQLSEWDLSTAVHNDALDRARSALLDGQVLTTASTPRARAALLDEQALTKAATPRVRNALLDLQVLVLTPPPDRRIQEDYAEVPTQVSVARRVVEDYAEAIAKTGGNRLLTEDYAEVVTTWLKMRLLSECYAEVVTTGSWPQPTTQAPFAGWS